MRILLIDGDRDAVAFLQHGLEEEGYAVDTLYDGGDVRGQVRVIDYDAIIMEMMLSRRSGLQVLREIRAFKGELPVLVLSSMNTIEDRVIGLDAGADDYMTKPFALPEISARLRALLRRGKPHLTTRLRLADLEVDVIRRSVARAGRQIELRPKEYALLEFLMRNSDRPVTRSTIIEHVWNIHFGSISNVVEVHINALRNKIDRGSSAPLIHTIRGVGYMLSAESSHTGEASLLAS
jgi:DNA-binding response OmpR family regulator